MVANDDVRVVCKEGVYMSDAIMLGDCRGEKFETLVNSLNYKTVRGAGSTSVFAKDGVAVVYHFGSAIVIGDQKTEMCTRELVATIQRAQQELQFGRSLANYRKT